MTNQTDSQDTENRDDKGGQNERVVTRGETAKCSLCAKVESPGFYTGCMCKDLGPQNGWSCDGDGNLTR